MLKRLVLVACVVGALGGTAYLAITSPRKVAASDLPTHTADLERGEWVFTASGCASCHAAPGAKDDDALIMSGGLELKSPYGSFYAPNISQDETHGIGGWSDAEFVTSLKHGTSPDGAHYFPAFPFTSYQQMQVSDMLDLHAYMKTLPSDATPSRSHDITFPFNIRRNLGVWKWLYAQNEVLPSDRETDDPVIHGRYISDALAHCAECHTPRNALGGLISDQWMAGAPDPHGRGMIPNITPHETGIGDWSESDIVYSLESGFTPSFDSFGSTMAAVQSNMAKLRASDREAIAAYLTSLAPLPSTPRP